MDTPKSSGIRSVPKEQWPERLACSWGKPAWFGIKWKKSLRDVCTAVNQAQTKGKTERLEVPNSEENWTELARAETEDVIGDLGARDAMNWL